jgi:hypothetical protein
MKLFGLIESMHLEGLFSITTGTIPVPHPALFEHIKQYSKKMLVGLEIESSKKVVKLPHVTFYNQEIQMDLLRHFKKKGNPVRFLEPMKLNRDLDELAGRMIEAGRAAEKSETAEERCRLQNEADKLQIEFAHQSRLGKEESLLESISKYKPDLVFLGLAHSSHFYRNSELLKQKYGIVIDEYYEDRIVREPSSEDILMAAKACDEHLSMEDVLEHDIELELCKVDSPDKTNVPLDRVMLERSYKAVREGRVTDDKPDYIGTWETALEHKGLFEVFVKERIADNCITRIRGTIEDCIGTAGFEGFIDGNKLLFTKRYTNALPNAAKGEINYNGLRHGPQKDGLYVGSYDAMGCRGDFWMKPFKEITQSKSL